MSFCRWAVLVAMIFVAGQLLEAGQAPAAMVDVLTWRIKPGGNSANDYWIDGSVRNTSGHMLTGVRLRFNILTRSGFVLGESEAPIKLTTLVPGQTCVFAAPVTVHDKRMKKIVLIGVTVETADDAVLYRDVPFSASKNSSLFRYAHRVPSPR